MNNSVHIRYLKNILTVCLTDCLLTDHCSILFLFSKKTLDSYGNTSKDITLDPNKTYRGVPYFFGLDPVSAHVNRAQD